MEESVDRLGSGKLRLIQGRRGYRFSLDPVLLCAFARIKEGENVADLGTGGGVIPLLLAERTKAAKIVGVEKQHTMAMRALRNIQLNGLEHRLEVLEEDIRNLPGREEESFFDVVLTNPPFRTVDSGRQALGDERAAARHELAGGLRDFLAAAARLLRNGGRFYIVFLADRLAELMVGMQEERLEPKRLRSVHSRAGEPARIVLVEGRKGGRRGITVMPPLFIYNGNEYSEEVMAIYAS